MLLLLQSSTAQESSTSSQVSPANSVQGEGESDVTGESSSQRAFRRFHLACSHAKASFESLFHINNMEDVYTDFEREFRSSGSRAFLQIKANSSEKCILQH